MRWCRYGSGTTSMDHVEVLDMEVKQVHYPLLLEYLVIIQGCGVYYRRVTDPSPTHDNVCEKTNHPKFWLMREYNCFLYKITNIILSSEY